MIIAKQIEEYTASISGFEKSRDYVSLSHTSLEAQAIVDTFLNGFEDSHEIRMRCYKGYQMERDLKERIKRAIGDRYSEAPEVVAFDGLVKGHPDFLIDSYPGDCKSVPLDEHLPSKVSRRIYSQMQGYMLYMKKNKAIVIYESRENGKIKEIWLYANESVQTAIDDKLCLVANLLGRKF